MPLSRRYTPEHPPGESCLFGLDFSPIIPPGVTITSCSLDIQTNTVPPVEASTDWTVTPVQFQDRVVYATLGGGINGKDYLFTWTVTDSDGNVWPRSAAILCSATS